MPESPRRGWAGHALSIWRYQGLLRLERRLTALCTPEPPAAELPARPGCMQERENHKRREQQIGLHHVENGRRQEVGDWKEVADHHVADGKQDQTGAAANRTRE